MPWWIVLSAGLEDGLNPCVLMSTAVFLILNMWFKSSGLNDKKLLVFFTGAFIVSTLVFNATIISVFLWSEPVVKILNILNHVAAILIALGAIAFFYQWLVLRVKKEKAGWLSGHIPKAPQGVTAISIVIVVALVMSVLSTVWPSNYHITFLSNNMFLPGRFWSSFIVFAFYVVTELWLLFVMWVLVNKIQMPEALRTIIISAFLCSASGAALYLL